MCVGGVSIISVVPSYLRHSHSNGLRCAIGGGMGGRSGGCGLCIQREGGEQVCDIDVCTGVCFCVLCLHFCMYKFLCMCVCACVGMLIFMVPCSSTRIVHSQHVIHRDIKPQNLLLDIKDRVKVGWCVSAYVYVCEYKLCVCLYVFV